MKKAMLFKMLIFAVCIFMSGCKNEPELEKEIPILPGAEIKYSDDAAENAALAVYAAIENAASAEGLKIPEAFDMRSFVRQFILSFEKRDVPQAQMCAATSAFANDELFLSGLLKAVKEGNALPFDDFLSLFGKLTGIIGSKKTSELMYDFTDCYTAYMAKWYHSLYEKNNNPAYDYLLREEELWLGYNASLANIGCEKVSCLVRIFAATTTYRSFAENGASEFVSGLTPGEILLFIKSEGEIIKKLELESSNIESILYFVSNECDLHFVSAVFAADDGSRISDALNDFIPLIGDVLCRLDAEDAKYLKDGIFDGFVYAIFQKMTDNEFAAFSSFFESEAVESKYESYLHSHGMSAEYNEFKSGDYKTTSDELRMASAEEFLAKLRDYVNNTSPIYGFLLTKDIKES